MNGIRGSFNTNGRKILENQYYFTNNSQVFIASNDQYIQEIIVDFEILFIGNEAVISSIVNKIDDVQKEAIFEQEILNEEIKELKKKISDLESTQKRIFKRLKRKLKAKVNGYE